MSTNYLCHVLNTIDIQWSRPATCNPNRPSKNCLPLANPAYDNDNDNEIDLF